MSTASSALGVCSAVKRLCFASSCTILNWFDNATGFCGVKMDADHRSGCPINLSVEVFGDKWSLLILRDMIFGGKRHFREMLRSEEAISSNILADRLKMLVEQ